MKKTAPHARRLGTRFLGDRSGNVAMLWGLMAAALLSLIGLSVDFARAQALRAQMQNAADGAVLAAARDRDMDEADRETAARAYFDQTFNDPALSNDVEFQLADLGEGSFRVSAQIDMELGLARLIRNEDWTIRVNSEAMSQSGGPLEVVIALDNTGSMSNDMGTLRTAAEDFVEYLFQTGGENVSIGLVPFVAQVNVGNDSSHLSWMDTAGANPHHGEMLEDQYMGYRATSNGSSSGNCTTPAANYPTTYGGFDVRWVKGSAATPGYTNTSRCYAFSDSSVNMFDIYNVLPNDSQWAGCVEARPEPYDISDAAPTSGTPATMFVPFFSLDDGGNVSSPANNWITSSTYDRTNVFGLGGSFTGSTNVRTLAPYKYRSGVTTTTATGTNSRGPNRGCPTSTPITPLTNDESTLVTNVRAMIHWNGGGTNQIEGLAWAWRVISPGAPFTEGRPYNDPNDPVRKVIVLFTDGDNTSLSNNNGALVSDYAALSYRTLWQTLQYATQPSAGSPGIPATWQRAGITSSGTMVDYMNDRQLALCQAVRGAGVEIYTIGFRITQGGTADQLLEDCATQDNAHYFHADSQAELLDAFAMIGRRIGDLRLTH